MVPLSSVVVKDSQLAFSEVVTAAERLLRRGDRGVERNPHEGGVVSVVCGRTLSDDMCRVCSVTGRRGQGCRLASTSRC